MLANFWQSFIQMQKKNNSAYPALKNPLLLCTSCKLRSQGTKRNSACKESNNPTIVTETLHSRGKISLSAISTSLYMPSISSSALWLCHIYSWFWGICRIFNNMSDQSSARKSMLEPHVWVSVILGSSVGTFWGQKTKCLCYASYRESL